eukprot:3857247-Rhodomonas_salina.4
MSGTDYALRAQYGQSGTDIGYAATILLRTTPESLVLTQAMLLQAEACGYVAQMLLGLVGPLSAYAPYGVSGTSLVYAYPHLTDIVYGIWLCACYAMPGTKHVPWY